MDLYPHQRVGRNFLAARKAAALCDEQGLGKTACAITAAEQLGSYPALIVAPPVVAYNWQREFEKWAPRRRVQVIETSADDLSPNADVVVVSHGLLAKPGVKKLARRWGTVVGDESHAFKTPDAARTRMFYDFLVKRADRCWLLSGTPMPNNPSELWTMLAHLAPERIQAAGKPRGTPVDWTSFRRHFCELERSAYGDGWKAVGAKNVPELRKRLDGFLLRRLKKDHLQLPPMRWGSQTLHVDELPSQLRAIEDSLPEGMSIADAIAGHPQFSTWRRLCGIAKAPAAAELLVDEMHGTDHKLVVFAHHVEVLDILAGAFAAAGIGYVRISGDVPAGLRTTYVNDFQSSPRVRVALCNIVAAGVGITLTAASQCVFIEQSFVPGENDQAACRLHRIGQKESVLVRVFGLHESVDDVVAEITARKAHMIQQVLS